DYRWKFVAVAIVLLAVGVAFWSLTGPSSGSLRVLSGQITIAGQISAVIPWDVPFAGTDAEAVVEVPGHARLELARSTRRTLRLDPSGPALLLASGGGQLHVLSSGVLRLETVLGTATTSSADFSLDLMTALPEQISPTEHLQLPKI